MKNLLAKLGNDKDDPKYVRNEQYLGNRKIIVGDGKADLVLETLGKVYIKSGRNNVLLNDLFKLLKEKTINADINDIVKSIIIVSSTDELKNMEYPGDGRFVYDSTNKILYISIFNQYVALVNARLDVENTYVKKSGDTMSGQLEIKTPYAPLIVHSTSMVKNLNAEMVGGYKSSEIAKIYKNEYIQGEWKFGKHCESLNTWKFHKNISLLSDLVSYGSLSSPQFASGFSGYGWRLDGTTNTLTIDNLVVRKLMMVYEMVINKISATNGAIWVSNSCKCESATKLTFIDNLIDTINVSIQYVESSKHIEVVTISGLRKGYFVLSQINDNSINTYIEGKNLSSNQYFGNAATFREITYVYNITNIDAFNSQLTHYLNAKLTEQYPTAIEATQEIKDSVNQWVYDVLTVPSNIGSVIKGIQSLQVRDSKATTQDYIHLDTSFQVLTLSQTDPVDIKVYYKYFGAPVQGDEFVNNYWIVNTDKEEYSLFQVGDLLRCQKMVDSGNIKYYDALVVSKLADRTFLVQKALSTFDMYSEVTYDEQGNVVIKNQYNDLYQTGDEVYLRDDSGDIVYDENGDPVMDPSKIIADIQEKDDLIQIGNIQNVNRQGAVYLTSSDNMSPYIDVISKIDRPDYSVIYRKPRWIMYKQYYVSQQPSDVLLGTFRVDRHTNLILGRALVTDVSDESLSWDLLVLYGHETPSSKCLAQRIVVKNADGEPQKDAQGNYIYTQLEDPTPISSTRIGRLDGIHDSIFSNNQPNGYGLYANNVFLTGEFYLNNGKSIASFADDIALLSGEIQHIDIDQLKQEVTTSVENIIEDKFKSMTEDEEGNEIPAGFAGLFTFDYTDITGDGYLDGKKGLAVLGDSIVFYTSENGKFDFNDPTALIRNKKINADLIDVKELEFDKLVGKSTIDSYEHVITVTYSYDQNTYENVKITGLVGLDYSRPAIGTLSNTLYGGILTLRDFNTEKGHNIKLKEINVDGVFTYDYEVSNRILANVSEVPLGDYISELDANGGEDVSISEIKKNTIEEYTITTINRKSKGESVIYYPDGSVLNAKIISTDTSGKVTGCVEYFFAQGKIRIDTLLDKGDEYIVQNFMEGEVQQEQYKGGLLKRINYFDFADSFVINWVQYYDRYDTKDEWIALFEDLYMNTGIQLNELEEMYDHMVKLDTAAKNGNGKYQSDYSNFVAAVLSSLHGTQGSGKIGKGSGYGSIQSGDKIFFPSGKWYSYDSQLEQKINDSIRNNENYYDDIKNKNIIEGLYITHYELKDPGTTEGEHNSGNFNILYFNSEKSIEGKITFTIENGNYNGGAGMSPIK